MNPIRQTRALGQQIWFDSLSRHIIQSGALAELIGRGVSGVTTNPAIFLKAIQSDASYSGEIAALRAGGGTAKTRYETLATADVQAACGLFAEEFQKHGGTSGFVSIEVDPAFAHDTAATVAEAARLKNAVARENVMIKVPATDAGIAAMEELVAQDFHVNMTLIFSLRQLEKIYAAYVRAAARAQNPARQRVVASVFLSRIDTAIDEKLPEALRGKTAVALAKQAYAAWRQFFENQPHCNLELLWASTGTKNPAYSDVLYVENLIGANTVNTLPEATLQAFAAHGRAHASLAENAGAAQQLADVRAAGIDLDALAQSLQDSGLQQFQQAFAAILAALE